VKLLADTSRRSLTFYLTMELMTYSRTLRRLVDANSSETRTLKVKLQRKCQIQTPFLILLLTDLGLSNRVRYWKDHSLPYVIISAVATTDIILRKEPRQIPARQSQPMEAALKRAVRHN